MGASVCPSVRPSLIPFLRKHDFVVSYAPRYIVMIVDLPRKEMTTLVFFYLLFPLLIITFKIILSMTPKPLDIS